MHVHKVGPEHSLVEHQYTISQATNNQLNKCFFYPHFMLQSVKKKKKK